MSDSKLAAANTARKVVVKASDLPLSCPTKSMAVWNSHPRVYLPIEETGKETCYYCGTTYVLEGSEPTS